MVHLKYKYTKNVMISMSNLVAYTEPDSDPERLCRIRIHITAGKEREPYADKHTSTKHKAQAQSGMSLQRTVI